MIELLSRIFIRDRKNTSDPGVRSAYGTLCSLTGVGLNIVLFAVKLIAISVAIMAAASWMGGELMLYTQEIFKNFAFIAR